MEIRCDREGCSNIFDPGKRTWKKYCSVKCGNKVRIERFAEKRLKGELNPSNAGKLLSMLSIEKRRKLKEENLKDEHT